MAISSSGKMRLTALTLLVGTVFAIGCASFEITSDADMTEASSNAYQTVHGSLYGFRWHEFSAQKCKDGPLARVEYTTNGLQLLGSAVSLGLYMPQTVEWWCAAPPEPNDDGDDFGGGDEGDLGASLRVGSMDRS